MKTECPQGHPYDKENSYVDPRGYMQCRTCRNDRMKARRAKSPGRGQGWKNAAKTHCPKGHEYTEENTYRWKKTNGTKCRVCKECERLRRRRQLLRKYGITEERFTEMLQDCNYQCPGCDLPFDDLVRQPDIDHFHDCCESGSCGKCVRGLLCHNCNLLIGHSSDSPTTLINLAQYLIDAEKFRARI